MPTAADDIDLTSLLSALRASLWRILAAAALLGAATYGILCLVPPSYKSTAQVILEPSGRGLLSPQAAQSVNPDAKVDENEVASQAEVIRSRDLLTKVAISEHLDQTADFNPALAGQEVVVRMLGLFSGIPANLTPMERTLLILEQSVRVTEVPKTRLISIDVTAHDAKLAASVANAIAQAYLERNRASQVKDASDTTAWIGSNIQDVKRQAETAESSLERFRAESGLLSGQNNISLMSQQLSELNTQLTQAAATRTEAEARARIVRGMVAGGRVESSEDIVKSPNMQQLFQQKLQVERDIAEVSATLLPAHPRMKQLAAQLSLTKQRLGEEALRVAAGLEDDVQVAAARETALKSDIARLSEIKLKSSDAEAKLGSLEREAQSKRNSYDLLLQRLNEVSNQRDRTAVSALASLNESAVPSRIIDSPRKSQLTLLVTAAGLLLGVFYVLSRELMRREPNATAIISKASGTPGVQTNVVSPKLEAQPAAVAFSDRDRLAKHLAGLVTPDSLGRILITGTDSAQSPVSVATDLAQRLTNASATAVVIDLCAASKPGEMGFDDLVAGRATFEDVLRSGGSSSWHRIMAGTGSERRETAGHVDKVEAVFAALDAIYTYVIVAAPRTPAKRLLEALGGNLAAGVLCSDRPGTGTEAIDDGFLGYDVAGMPVVLFNETPRTNVAWFSKKMPAGRGVAPA